MLNAKRIGLNAPMIPATATVAKVIVAEPLGRAMATTPAKTSGAST